MKPMSFGEVVMCGVGAIVVVIALLVISLLGVG
jgi:hypothetical protein